MIHRLVAICVVAAALFPAAASAQSFTCPIGRQASCLDYGDKVVPQDSQCFDSYTCFPGGFVCKSDMDDLAKKAKTIAEHYDDLRTCLSNASDMEDVQGCVRQDTLYGG